MWTHDAWKQKMCGPLQLNVWVGGLVGWFFTQLQSELSLTTTLTCACFEVNNFSSLNILKSMRCDGRPSQSGRYWRSWNPLWVPHGKGDLISLPPVFFVAISCWFFQVFICSVRCLVDQLFLFIIFIRAHQTKFDANRTFYHYGSED